MIKAFNTKWIIKRYKDGALIMDDFIMENTNGDRMIFKCSIPPMPDKFCCTHGINAFKNVFVFQNYLL